jgi:D-lactate dehydrogenase
MKKNFYIMNQLLQQLIQVAGQQYTLTDPAECLAYSYDNSRLQVLPLAVVFAQTHEHAAKVVRWCYENSVPVVARGRGTGTPGGSVPVQNGIVLSFEQMQRILAIEPADRYLIAEAGVINQACQHAAAQHGFFWPPDPSSQNYCTIGGNLAYNSAGPRAIKYGTPRENTLGLTAITGTGETLHTGVRTTKGVVGYDLTRLIIGSEGTLAIITSAILKLTPMPEKRCLLRATYRTLDAATEAISRIMAQPITPYALEFIDSSAIKIIQQYSPLNLPANTAAILLIEIDGLINEIPHRIAQLHRAAEQTELLDWQIAETPEEQEQLWQARKALSPALRNFAPDKINEDVVVPVSKLPELIAGLERFSHQYQIPIVNFGHAGNGNIHVNLLYDAKNTQQAQNVNPCLDAVFNLVLDLGGTLSGEHGIGLVKKPFVNRELDATALQLMQQIKLQFDPKNILNPGKMF